MMFKFWSNWRRKGKTYGYERLENDVGVLEMALWKGK